MYAPHFFARGRLCLALLVFVALIPIGALSQVNSWLKPTSGYWEEPYWSLGHMPAYPEDVAFTNSGWKALAIGSGTTLNYPDSLHIHSLAIDAPSDSGNLLLLNYAGLTVPLRPENSIVIGPYGSLLSYYSAVQSALLQVEGHATFAELSEAQFDAVHLATNGTGPGELNLSNGLFSVSRMFIGKSNAFNRGGTFNLNDGIFTCSSLDVIDGGVVQTGGTNRTATTRLLGARFYPGYYDLRDGRVESETVALGEGNPNMLNTFSQSGGVHSNSMLIVAYGQTNCDARGCVFHTSGSYSLTGGLLFSPTIALAGGEYYQSGGTNYVGQLWLTNGGHGLLTGGTLVSDRTDIENFDGSANRPQFTQFGGEHYTTMLRLDSGGIYDLDNATLGVGSIHLRSGTRFDAINAIIASNEIFELDGGTALLNGTYDLGWLMFNGTSYLDCGAGDAILRFTKVGYPPPALDGVLYIKNWKGSVQSPGRDQIYITEPDQYTPSRVNSMFFIDPAGFPPGTYRARMKPSGEIVPLAPAHISFTRNQNGFTLTWPEGYQLYSSPEVTGPYEPVSDATGNQYQVSFTDPQRFFILRPSTVASGGTP